MRSNPWIETCASLEMSPDGEIERLMASYDEDKSFHEIITATVTIDDLRSLVRTASVLTLISGAANFSDQEEFSEKLNEVSNYVKNSAVFIARAKGLIPA